MSVPKSKRPESKFEVYAHWFKTRKEVTNLLAREFSYNYDEQVNRICKQFGVESVSEIPQERIGGFKRVARKQLGFNYWYIDAERGQILSLMQEIGKHVFIANSIYPQSDYEITQRRNHQNEVIGLLNDLIQELQYVITTLPVDINQYTRLSDMIQTEISLVKAWRKSDNKHRASSDSANNASYVNNNGNVNNNNADNDNNGVRPDFNPSAQVLPDYPQMYQKEKVSFLNGK